MNKRNKRGFTIVELVIVIAIIGVLSAILIPTFTGLINSAREAADIQMVKNLNTALATDAAVNGKHETAYDAIKVANETGYAVEKLTPTATYCDIVWDRTTDRFVIMSGNEVKFCDETKTPSTDKINFWKIYKLEDIMAKNGTLETDEEYSIFLAKTSEKTSITLNTGLGLDVGENTSIKEVTYAGNGEVIVRTNGQNLIVNSGTVHHYGWVNELTVNEVESYHEYGHVVSFSDKKITSEFVAHNGASFHVDRAYLEKSILVNATGLENCLFGDSNYDGGVCIFCGDSLWLNVVSDFDEESRTIIEINTSNIKDGEITIPSSIGGKPVTTIGSSALAGNNTITSVIVSEGIETIGISAFEGCENLEKVTLPSSVTTIEMCAFGYCPSLKEITIPSSVTTIEICAFTFCKKLENVTLPSGITTIGTGAFQNCTSLSTISLPNELKTIEEYAFYQCSSLTSINLPEGLKTIGEYAFESCVNLNTINIPSTVTSIGTGAFQNCTSLSTVTLSERLTIIEVGTFNGCTSLKEITMPSNLTTIRGGAFTGSGLTSIDLSKCKNLTNIEKDAFDQCSSLTTVRLPKELKNIDGNPFYACNKLTTVNFEGTMDQWKGISGYENVKVPVECTDGTIN